MTSLSLYYSISYHYLFLNQKSKTSILKKNNGKEATDHTVVERKNGKK